MKRRAKGQLGLSIFFHAVVGVLDTNDTSPLRASKADLFTRWKVIFPKVDLATSIDWMMGLACFLLMCGQSRRQHSSTKSGLEASSLVVVLQTTLYLLD